MPLSADDKMEIQELACRYAVAMDRGDSESWLATWAENGTWQGGLGTYSGKAQLARLLSDLGQRIQGKRHVMCNFVIDGDQDSATQTCYLLVIEAQNAAALIATAVYSDVLKKIAGRWRFSERRVQLDPSFRPVS